MAPEGGSGAVPCPITEEYRLPPGAESRKLSARPATPGSEGPAHLAGEVLAVPARLGRIAVIGLPPLERVAGVEAPGRARGAHAEAERHGAARLLVRGRELVAVE